MLGQALRRDARHGVIGVTHALAAVITKSKRERLLDIRPRRRPKPFRIVAHDVISPAQEHRNEA